MWIKTGVGQDTRWRNDGRNILIAMFREQRNIITVFVHVATTSKVLTSATYLNMPDAEKAMKHLVDTIDALDAHGTEE